MAGNMHESVQLMTRFGTKCERFPLSAFIFLTLSDRKRLLQCRKAAAMLHELRLGEHSGYPVFFVIQRIAERAHLKIYGQAFPQAMKGYYVISFS